MSSANEGAERMSIEKRALVPRVGVASLCSPLEVGADRAPQAAADLARLLQTAGCEVIELGPADRPEKASAAGRKLAELHVHAVAMVATSWFEDYLVFDLLEECAAPLLLWSLPGMETGALCGVQQLTACLKQLGTPYRAVFGPLDSAECQKRARAFLRAAALAHRLRRARIGLAGHRVAGMSEVAVNEFALKKALGPRIVPLDLPQLLSAAREVSDQQVAQQWQEVVGRAAACKVSDADGLDSMKTHVAVRKLIEQYGLDAVAIGCYPHLMGRVCLAASLLADEGVPLACEGDVNGALGQLMLTLLTGQPTHNTDWLDPLDADTVVLTHCGSGSFSLAEKAEDVQLASVRLMGQGVCALFPARPGPVTMVNIIPCDSGYQIALLEGEAVSTPMVFPGNPLRVGFGCPIAQLIEWIHDEGIGHHWMAGYGHVGEELRQWAKIVGPGLRLVSPLGHAIV
jgi:L-fucose isomerase-like protein